jgi:hypothetical protein
MTAAAVNIIKAGDRAAGLFQVWRYGSGDWLEPYRLYNGLNVDLRPLTSVDGEPHRPPYPTRVRAFVFGCAQVAADIERKR